MPDPTVDLNVVAQSISISGTPTRKNCLSCHSPGLIDWDALGWTKDPLSGGDRVE